MSTENMLAESEARLLLVEDNDDDAFLFRKKIEKGLEFAFVDDISLTRVDSLSAAVETCQADSFDAVFMDLGLPDSNGIETIKRFTEQEFGLPVIVMTGLQDKQTSLEAIQYGAQDYLVKGESSAETIVRAMHHAIERKANQQKVQRQRDQLEFFNSILRHDLLNGMQIIQARAQSLSGRLEGDQQANIEKIVDWSDNIVELTRKTRDILDAVTNEEPAELYPIQVQDLVVSMTGEIEQMREGVTVETDLPSDLTVNANDLLADILRNLLTNAVEHTEPETVTIQVRAEQHDDSVRVAVEDDGPGIPESQRDSVFERGEKGQSSSGSGFGLYFVSSMIDTYDGDIWLEPAEPGARFVMQIPAA